MDQRIPRKIQFAGRRLSLLRGCCPVCVCFEMSQVSLRRVHSLSGLTRFCANVMERVGVCSTANCAVTDLPMELVSLIYRIIAYNFEMEILVFKWSPYHCYIDKHYCHCARHCHVHHHLQRRNQGLLDIFLDYEMGVVVPIITDIIHCRFEALCVEGLLRNSLCVLA